MTDMRNFNPTTSNDIRAETVLVDSDDVIVKERYALEEDGAGLGQFHHTGDYAENQNGTAKTVGALVVALMLGGAGAYVYTMMPQQDVVADADLPRPAGPGATAAITPPPPVIAPEATVPMGDATATGEVAPTSAPVIVPPIQRQTSAASSPAVTPPMRTAQARVTTPAADPTPMTSSPVPSVTPPVAPVMPQTQASNVPEPVSPTPPASAIAGNPPLNEQSAPAPAESAPGTPAPLETAPQPASPAEPEATPSAPNEPIP